MTAIACNVVMIVGELYMQFVCSGGYVKGSLKLWEKGSSYSEI